MDRGGTNGERRALAEVIGALAYALLRVFQLAARATHAAPTMALRERQAAFAVEQFERYQVLRRRLSTLTDDVEAALERYRAPLDSFYDAARMDAWLDAQVFHYVGENVTSDFAEMVAPRLDEKTAAAVRDALTGRAAHAAFALQQITEALAAGGAEAEERCAAAARIVVGEGLNRLREALFESDALAIVVGGEDRVKELVLEMLARHRERLEILGIERVE